MIVPKGCKDIFSDVSPWNQFSNIEEQLITGFEDININGDKESIREINQTTSCVIYNLNGARVSDTTEGLVPGIYIVKTPDSIRRIVIR